MQQQQPQLDRGGPTSSSCSSSSSSAEAEDRQGVDEEIVARTRDRVHRPAKRRRLLDGAAGVGADAAAGRAGPVITPALGSPRPVRDLTASAEPWSLGRVVSPPLWRNGGRSSEREDEGGAEAEDDDETEDETESEEEAVGGAGREKVQGQRKCGPPSGPTKTAKGGGGGSPRKPEFVSSPIHLSRIQDIHDQANTHALALEDILCDPLIVECWQFNYLFDVDFLMSAFDEDVRSTVRVKVVHGNWRREDAQRIRMEEWAKRYPNLEVIQAYMPEAFGTHHSKMMILIRADDYAQVVIHTANMIRQDWRNLTQAVWCSPLLPLVHEEALTNRPRQSRVIGRGDRFKSDLLRYLRAYGKRLTKLIDQLKNYCFSDVRAALVASTPCRVSLGDTKPEQHTSWGWVGLEEVLQNVPASHHEQASTVVAQISSIATLGQTDAWLEHFRGVLSTCKREEASSSASATTSMPATFRPASQLIHPSSPSSAAKHAKADLRIIFPTTQEVRASLDGYASGASIHLKTQSAAQQKQLAYLRPKLCRWAAVPPSDTDHHLQQKGLALRGRAAPHVKTYVRFTGEAEGLVPGETRIDWALLTSANLSTQAWGALPAAKKGGTGGSSGKSSGSRGKGKSDDGAGMEVRICSWEIGVLVWPELWADAADGSSGAGGVAAMVPVFGKDGPTEADAPESFLKEGEAVDGEEGGGTAVVGLRMPYDLPLRPYEKGDEAWCATAPHWEPDGRGFSWEG